MGVIGVIILAVIVLIIASITYAYVESIRVKPDEEIKTHLKGHIISITENRCITFKERDFLLFDVVLRNESNITASYPMFFYDLYPPLEKRSYQLFYDKTTIDGDLLYRIVRVDLL